MCMRMKSNSEAEHNNPLKSWSQYVELIEKEQVSHNTFKVLLAVGP